MNTLQQALQHHQAGRLPEAERLYRHILARDPKNFEALHFLGVVSYQSGRLDAALELIGKAIALRPEYAEAHVNLGVVLRDAGRLDEAIASNRRSVALQPNLVEGHHNLAIALMAKGQLDESIAALGRTIALKPNHPEAHSNLGNALRRRGRLDEAVATLRRAIELNPRSSGAYSNLGFALKDLGRNDESVAAHRQAVALAPKSVNALNNLGVALMENGQIDESIAAHRQAIALSPSSAESYANLGNVLKHQGKLDEAVAAYQKAATLRPNVPEIHCNFGIILREYRQLDAAVAAFRQAIALRPNYGDAYSNLGLVLTEIGQLDEAIAASRRAVELNPNYAAGHSNLLLSLHYLLGFDAQVLAEEHRRWNTKHADPLRSLIAPHANDRDPDRVLRIGYVSADFRRHAIAYFFENLLAFHDRQRVNVFCYSNLAHPDSMTAHLRKQADQWRDVAAMSDQALADLIRQDGIDILVDLSGHTNSNRLLVFARKPAPIQVTYMGYPDTTGMRAIDYRFTDEQADPPGKTESLHSEQLDRLPRTFLSYRPIEDSPPIGPLPASSADHVTLGSFGSQPKINAPLVNLWSRILREIPDSQMILKNHGLRSRAAQQMVSSLFAARGIAPDRIELLEAFPREAAHLQVYNRIDIALDTYPYHGTTTTCEAMWMGVPTVTLAGPVHASRVGVSLLNSVGLGELIADSEEQYIRLAVDLARDVPRLKALRSNLRARMSASPLMDSRQFAQKIEMAYRQMWRRWIERASPK